jgi:hypothetical protein
MNRLVSSGVLVGVLAVAVVAALAAPKFGSTSGDPKAPASALAEARPTDAPAAARAPASARTLAGIVLEKIDVPNYTYLRVGPSGSTGTWAAVPTTDVKVGQSVQIDDAMEMVDFNSATLKRTFDRIYFGVLAGSQKKEPTAQPADPAAALPAGHGASSADIGASHGAPAAAGDAVPVGKVDKASGAAGYRIAELFAKRDALSGKVVRVRGVVVKTTPGVLGRTFAHLRDGSGSAPTGDHDLTVTGETLPAVGTTILVEGTLTKDMDFGSGYRYPILLEGARTVGE